MVLLGFTVVGCLNMCSEFGCLILVWFLAGRASWVFDVIWLCWAGWFMIWGVRFGVFCFVIWSLVAYCWLLLYDL